MMSRALGPGERSARGGSVMCAARVSCLRNMMRCTSAISQTCTTARCAASPTSATMGSSSRESTVCSTRSRTGAHMPGHHSTPAGYVAVSFPVRLAALPQVNVQDPHVTSDYWIETVAARSKQKAYSWDFIMFVTGEDAVKSYLAASGDVSARRDILSLQIQDREMEPFVRQALIGSTAFQPLDRDKVDMAMETLIELMHAEGIDPSDILGTAQDEVTRGL